MTPTDTVIYADSAATSFPKPPEVRAVLSELAAEMSLSPGRSAHRFSLACSRYLFETRELLAELFNCDDSSRIVFTANVTESLNLAIFGLLDRLLRRGDHVVTTCLEHNSVMRPLRYLESHAGIRLSLLPLNSRGMVDIDLLPPLIQDETKLLVINHVSNVTGALADLAAVGRCKKNALLLVDAAQSAGVFPIDVKAMGIDMLAFTGHKALLGPTGTGGLYLREGITLHPLKMGGTGSNSELELQPDFAPDRYESGTPNSLGIAALGAGLRYLQSTGLEVIRNHEQQLCRRFLRGLRGLDGISIYGPPDDAERGAVVSLRLEGKSESDVARLLDRDFGILVRTGLHCAPAAHRAIGTFPNGTVRFSFGFFNTAAEIDSCLTALRSLLSR